jgi:hypothetical protein
VTDGLVVLVAWGIYVLLLIGLAFVLLHGEHER